MKKLCIVLSCISILAFTSASSAMAGENDPESPEKKWESLMTGAVRAYKEKDYERGAPLAEKGYQLALDQWGENHENTFTAINNLAITYKALGWFEAAEPLYEKRIRYCEKTHGPSHPITLKSVGDLALLYESLGRPGEAEPIFKEVLTRSETAHGKENPSTMNAMTNLAMLFGKQGRYAEAEPLFLGAHQISEKLKGRDHPITLGILNNLAGLYNTMGRYAKAEPLFETAAQRAEKALGRTHPYTQNFKSNLAGVYVKQGRHAEAEPLLKEVARVYTETAGKEHPYTLGALNNLAHLYITMDRYEEAAPLAEEVFQIHKKNLGPSNPHTLKSMNNLAGIRAGQGQYQKAEPLLKEALRISEQTLGQGSPGSLEIRLSYISLLVNMERKRSAFRLMKRMENHLFSRPLMTFYRQSDDRVKRTYRKMIFDFQDMVLSFVREHPETTHQQYAANVMLRWKDVFTEMNAVQRRLLAVGRDPDVKKLNSRISAARVELGAPVHRGEAGKDPATLRRELDAAENALRQKAGAMDPILAISDANLDRVAEKLPEDSGLIEFRSYRPYDFKTGKLGAPRWAAFLLLSDIEADRQIFVEDLGGIEAFLKSFNDSEREKDVIYRRLLGKFDERIKPLKTLYIAPDGLLNLISFASLIPSEGEYLATRHRIRRLLTGRDLLTTPRVRSSNVLVAFGGVKYGDLPSLQNTAGSASPEERAMRLNARAGGELGGFIHLESSLFEVKAIAEMFTSAREDGEVFVFKGADAVETQFKRSSRPPGILHLSTPAFFLQNRGSRDRANPDAPFLLSGVALAGANPGLDGVLDEVWDDGLLYGVEILGLNLQGAELVSISTADAGKGEFDFSQGFTGLVRAFRTAGAQSVLLPNGAIESRASKAFMEKFYENLLTPENKSTPAEALHQTRLYFISHPEEEYRDPKIWAPYAIYGK